MKAFDEDVYPHPVYRAGTYCISLRKVANWYARQAISKGKTYSNCHVKSIIPLIVDKVFFIGVDEEELDLSLNLDCMIADEAEFVKKELEFQITGEVLAFFPKIASQLDEKYWSLTDEMELYIYVPELYEEQRGRFF